MTSTTQPTPTTTEALRRAERKLAAYVGVCKGDKELTDTVLPMVRAALEAALSTAPAGDVPGMVLAGAIADIAAERRRQIETEGWTPEHDDEHDRGEMARAAGCYALQGFFRNGNWQGPRYDIENYLWPWSLDWWKPSDARRNLVKAGALIVAEIERLDRLSTASTAGKE